LWWVGCFIQGVPPTDIKPEQGRDHVMTEAADFADFVQRRSGALLRAAWLLTSGDWALAEDLAQTALLARLRLVPGLADMLTEGTAA
jgi:hypothetical protein